MLSDGMVKVCYLHSRDLFQNREIAIGDAGLRNVPVPDTHKLFCRVVSVHNGKLQFVVLAGTSLRDPLFHVSYCY